MTYRQLLVSAEHGLITGDPTRPYIRLAFPQGDVDTAVQAVRVTVQAVKALYASLPVHAGDALREGIKIIRSTVAPSYDLTGDVGKAAVAKAVWNWARKKWRNAE